MTSVSTCRRPHVSPPVTGTFDISTDGDAANNSVRLRKLVHLCTLLTLEAKPDTSDFFPAAIKACNPSSYSKI